MASPAPSLTWVGHATFVLRLGGKLDRDRSRSGRSASALSSSVERRSASRSSDLPPLDVVTVSHNHYDHLDAPTIARIGAGPLYVTPLGNGALADKGRRRRVVELDWWQSHVVDGVEITLVPARHWSMRAPWNRNDALVGRLRLSRAEGVAYHSGDTALFDGFAEIGRAPRSRSIGRCCRSAPTSRAGSWSRST